tara:strand:- start:86 stop:778 length:693 start_codon:yes stop_codon:yes gene_type:complete
MSFVNLRNLSFFIFLFIVFSFYLFDLDNFFSIQFLKENNDFILEKVNNNFYASIIIFYLFFLIFISFFLPIIAIMIIFSSYLFGLLSTIFLSLFIITFGGVLNIYLLKKLDLKKIFYKAKKYTKKIKYKIRKSEMQYLIILRFIPIPFILQNAVHAILNISKYKFIVSTAIGIFPWITIYSLAGNRLREIINFNNEIKIKDILNYENFSIIFLFLIFITLSIFLKRKIKL